MFSTSVDYPVRAAPALQQIVYSGCQGSCSTDKIFMNGPTEKCIISKTHYWKDGSVFIPSLKGGVFPRRPERPREIKV